MEMHGQSVMRKRKRCGANKILYNVTQPARDGTRVSWRTNERWRASPLSVSGDIGAEQSDSQHEYYAEVNCVQTLRPDKSRLI